MNQRTAIPLLIVIFLVIVTFWAWKIRQSESDPPPLASIEIVEPPPPKLSDLARPPDWSQLDPWQEVITRSEFVEMMDSVFTVSHKWKEWFEVGPNQVVVKTGDPAAPYTLKFRPIGDPPHVRRYWRPATELPPAPSGLPLKDVKIAIDPGHIGGDWAKIEERWFQVGENKPVREGNMTLQVAKLIRPKLESLGAQVSLIRTENEPVTNYRPESLMAEALEIDPDSPRILAERLFYRTAEIRSRADKVNYELQPDLVLCLHFNADSWGDPLLPQLVPKNHLHLILNGAYTDGEVELADQRFEILRKIVEGIHPEEVALAESVAASFVVSTQLPPYLYEPNSKRAVNVNDNPYLWARNLLANRLYRCPVVFLEPYVMNSLEDHERIQAGDYRGLREVAGKLRPSIFREYSDSVVAGLTNYFTTQRKQAE